MRKFTINLFNFSLIWLIPLIILGITYLLLDPFKVIKTYQSFYDLNAKGWVGLNKDYISTKTFENNSKKINYNSFIFGNSRSMFYQISDWKKHLPDKSSCFHFDASGEALYAINKKIEYINKQGFKIENVLLVLDKTTLKQDKPKSGHLFIITPTLVNNANVFDFHKTFFLAFLHPQFLYAYLDFQISGVVKPYMKEKNLIDDRPRKHDLLTNEIQFDYFENLALINKYYTKNRLSDFYERDSIEKFSTKSIDKNHKLILTNIQSIFKKHNTNLKIVISPLYDQKKLDKTDLAYLKNLFGAQNVFDFSGINEFTNDYRNYYESSHYRPHVARKIMEKIYAN